MVKREPKNRGIFPLRFGLTSEALREQREGEETETIFRETLLNFIKHYQDDKTLEARTTLNLNAERPYNEENLEKIYKITKRFDYCENHTPECALMYNLVEIIPSFYSTKNFLQQQFPNKKETLNNLTFFPVPFATIEEPIRIR